MDSSLGDRIFIFLRENLLISIVGFIGLILFGYGLIVLLGQNGEDDAIVFSQGKEQQQTDKQSEVAGATTPQSEIIVDIQGAVLHPGVYLLPKDSRVKDALIKAGGLSEDADRDWIAKKLNLAVKLSDGMKVYIPRIGEDESQAISNVSAVSSDGKININSASQKELESLPGIGAVTAEKVISKRPYSSIDELLSRKVISKRVFEQIKEKVSAL